MNVHQFYKWALVSYLQYLKLLSNDLHLTLNPNIDFNIPIMHTE